MNALLYVQMYEETSIKLIEAALMDNILIDKFHITQKGSHSNDRFFHIYEYTSKMSYDQTLEYLLE